MFQSSSTPFQLMVSAIADYAIYWVDLQGTVMSWNLGAQNIYGYPATDMIGQPLSRLYSTRDPNVDRVQQSLEITLSIGRFEEETEQIRRDGSSFWVHTIMTSIQEPEGLLLGFAIVARDITNQKEAEIKLFHDAFHDSLTHLPNRTLFQHRLNHVLELAKRQKNYLFAVMFLDLDRFKLINDSLGHLLGDQLLIEVANRLKRCLRPTDTVARFGGDEFAILLEHFDTQKHVTEIADRIQKEIALPIHLADHEIQVTTSIGITLSSIQREQAEDYIRDADVAMYHAKDQGRARHAIFSEAMHVKGMNRLRLEIDLRHTIEAEELYLEYQPIVSLKNQRIEGFEALVRWRHPTLGNISPAEFIPIAEETDLIILLGDWVLREACKQMKKWREELALETPLSVSVNCSAKQFSQRNFVAKIQQLLEEYNLSSQCLKLEITESVILKNATLVADTLVQLQAMGVRISIDDFGTGYSSLSYLHRFPIDTLKIDRSFVDRIDLDGDKLELVRTIINLAWNLGMDVVAEGVETNKQMSQLKALKCESIQGFLVSRPLNASGAVELMKEQLNNSSGPQGRLTN